MALLLFMVAAVAVDWPSLDSAARSVFGGLAGLGLVMLWRAVRAGARLNFLYFPRTAATAAAWDRLDPGRVSSKLDVNICYCSVFDECWGGDITEFTLHPKRVAKCTPSKTAYE